MSKKLCGYLLPVPGGSALSDGVQHGLHVLAALEGGGPLHRLLGPVLAAAERCLQRLPKAHNWKHKQLFF